MLLHFICQNLNCLQYIPFIRINQASYNDSAVLFSSLMSSPHFSVGKPTPTFPPRPIPTPKFFTPTPIPALPMPRSLAKLFAKIQHNIQE